MEAEKAVLVVDDEEMIREVVSSYLKKKGFPVCTAETGKEALRIFERQSISFVILDLMLPDLSGEEVCAAIRRQSRVPILMLTAKTQEADLLNGLKIGADDYMMKPFSLKELHARMEAILRRTAGGQQTLASKFFWNGGDLEADLGERIVKKQGKPVSMTPIEWKIFSALIRYPQKIFTRDDLIALAFDAGFDGYDRVIDTHVKNLRKKLETDPRRPVYIRTVHGVGYRFGGENI